jgi:hypothetical protein
VHFASSNCDEDNRKITEKKSYNLTWNGQITPKLCSFSFTGGETFMIKNVVIRTSSELFSIRLNNLKESLFLHLRLYNISPGVVPYWLSGRNQIGILTCRLTNDQLQHALMSACSGRVLDSGNPDFTSGLFRCCFYGIKYHNIYKKYIFCSVHLTIYIIISISIIISSFSFLVLILKSPGVVPYWLSGRNQIGILTCRLTNDQLQHALMSLWIVSDGM